MRKIEFRGKNAKGEWIYGDLLRNRGETFIAPEGIANPLATADDFRVDPETVGQFTGLKDKSGNEIYEGDIVRDRFTDDGCYVVEWDSERLQMIFAFHSVNGKFMEDFNLTDINIESLQIIANPELIAE